MPVPSLLADSGGRGIMMILACQGLAQIEERWGKPATRSVLDTSNQLYVTGSRTRTRSRWCPTCATPPPTGCGARRARPRITRWRRGMIRRLPKRRALVLRGGMPPPVITHLPMVWHDWRYRWARLRRPPVADSASLAAARARTAAPRRRAAAPRPASRGDRRQPNSPAAAANGNGHANAPTAKASGRPAYPWDTAVTGPGPGRRWPPCSAARRTAAQGHPPGDRAADDRSRIADLGCRGAPVARHGAKEARSKRKATPRSRRRGGGSWARPGSAEAIARLRSWVETVFRRGYGHLAGRSARAGSSTICALLPVRGCRSCTPSIFYWQPERARLDQRPTCTSGCSPPRWRSWRRDGRLRPPAHHPADPRPALTRGQARHSAGAQPADPALAYAAAGWPVFPQPPAARPRRSGTRTGQPQGAACHGAPGRNGHGLHDVTTDAGQDPAWWGRSTRPHHRIATGAPGPDVVDIDVKREGAACRR